MGLALAWLVVYVTTLWFISLRVFPKWCTNCAFLQFDARDAGFSCPNAAKIQSYCDSADPYCCNGNDDNTHQGYGAEYGKQAFQFIQSKTNSTAPKC